MARPLRKKKSLLSAKPDNLTSSARTLLCLHHQFGYRCFNDIQTWAQEGCYNIPFEVSKCLIPTCLTFEFGKATKQPHANATNQLGIDWPEPGDFISVNTMEAGVPGKKPFTSGRPSNCHYTNSKVWVNQSSKHL
jgi:hypothetical protein